ncbi:hypothetical protein [Rubinisphaera italica]|nr:hypothetical protein [Rubinisphaera italica]
MKRKFSLFVTTLLLFVILGISFSSPTWRHAHTAGDHPHQHGHGNEPDHGHSHTHSHSHDYSHSHRHGHTHSHVDEKAAAVQEHAHFSLFGYVFTIALPSRSEAPKTAMTSQAIDSQIVEAQKALGVTFWEAEEFLSWSVLLKFDLLPLNGRLSSPILIGNGSLIPDNSQWLRLMHEAPPTPPPKMNEMTFPVFNGEFIS